MPRRGIILVASHTPTNNLAPQRGAILLQS
jgi:hypothetical protein